MSDMVKTIYADDLKEYRILKPYCSDNEAFKLIRVCQRLPHRWGSANRVSFDAGKASARILPRQAT
eukprot:8014352-Alexandrium_andersonii.AAC.1